MRLTGAGSCHSAAASIRRLSHVLRQQPRLCGVSGQSVLAPRLIRHNHEAGSKGISGAPRASVLTVAGAAQLPPMLQALLSPATLALTVLSAMAISAWANVRRKASPSAISADTTQFNKGVLSRCPTINSPYKPFPFLTNGHVETIFASKTRRSPSVTYDRESMTCPDGGTVHLDYHNLPTSIVGIAHHNQLAIHITCSAYTPCIHVLSSCKLASKLESLAVSSCIQAQLQPVDACRRCQMMHLC